MAPVAAAGPSAFSAPQQLTACTLENHVSRYKISQLFLILISNILETLVMLQLSS